MTLIIDFLLQFLSIFFGGIASIFVGFFTGVIQIFNLPEYFNVFSVYSDYFKWWQWIIAVITLVIVIGILACLAYLIVHYVRKFVRLNSSKVVSQDLVDQIGKLNYELKKMQTEKERILDLKIDSLGKAGFSLDGEENEDEENAAKGESRFYKLSEVDEAFENFVERDFDKSYTLEELCDRFRNFACSELKLFYEIRVIRLFFAGLATTRLIILQGISGTGKTSLPYAIGKFIKNNSTVASVQPSWRDRTELFGYFNEFTKRFNETEVLKKMYEATLNDSLYLTILDEMNIARVEYYFAEMLSILEMPTRDQWIVDLVPNGWPSDPKNVKGGRFTLPENMWFIGTANNDDSTFAISDKVYDRAIPINIDSKGVAFDAPHTEPLEISASYLEELYKQAMVEHAVSQQLIDKIDKLDNYVIEHFRLAFGNRIVKQLKEFVPAYIACGGTEIDGVDYVLANKILRKFESLNLSFIRDEIDGLVTYLDKNFGKANMNESKAYLLRLKKLF